MSDHALFKAWGAIGKAWNLVWEHKILWVFGLLSIFLGQFGLSNFLGQIIGKEFFGDSIWPTSWGAINVSTPEEIFWFVWTLLIILGLFLVIVVAAVCAQGALVATAVHWYHKKKILPAGDAWRQGVKHFWSVLTINILEKLCLSFLLSLVFFGIKFFTSTSLVGLFGLIVYVAVALFLALVISTVSIYALGYTVVDNLTVPQAVHRAWQLFSAHLLVSLELSIMLVLLNAMAVLALSLFSFLVLVPSFFISILAGFSGLVNLLYVAVFLYLILFLIFAALVGAVFNAFTISAWMYLFSHMHKHGLRSTLVYWWSAIFKRVKAPR
jgi:hypothetical protein